MKTFIDYSPPTLANGAEGDPAELWYLRLGAIKNMTPEKADEIEIRLFADLLGRIKVSRHLSGEPGWWVSSLDDEGAHFIDLAEIFHAPGGLYDARKELMSWFQRCVDHPVRVAVRLKSDGEMEFLATPGVELFIIDERAPFDRVYKHSSTASERDIELLIGDSEIHHKDGYTVTKFGGRP